ncbi:MAG: hypothetical protein Q9165_002984 [Trypethelium subeluteriae]
MPLLDEPAHQAPERDDLDDLLNYDASMDDVFKDTNDESHATTKGIPESRRGAADGGADLGIDEEIKITKRRKPIAKLDEARKTMQMKRKEWIDESKPRIRYDTTPEPIEEFSRDAPNNAEEREAVIDDLDVHESPQDHGNRPERVEEAVDANRDSLNIGDGDGEDDDLDAIMADHTERMAEQQEHSKEAAHTRDDFEDEMDAMAELDDVW